MGSALRLDGPGGVGRGDGVVIGGPRVGGVRVEPGRVTGGCVGPGRVLRGLVTGP